MASCLGECRPARPDDRSEAGTEAYTKAKEEITDWPERQLITGCAVTDAKGHRWLLPRLLQPAISGSFGRPVRPDQLADGRVCR